MLPQKQCSVPIFCYSKNRAKVSGNLNGNVNLKIGIPYKNRAKLVRSFLRAEK